MLWIMITKQTNNFLIGADLRKLAINVSTTALIADNATTKTTDNMLNCLDNQTPLHTRFRIKRKNSRTLSQ